MMRAGAKRIRPNVASTSVVGSVRDLAVLRSLAWADVLSTRQVAQLHFPSRRTAQRRLRALLDHGLVRASLQGDALQHDNVYALTRRGVDRTADLHAPATLPRPGRIPRPQRLAHALAIRDVFVAFRRSDRRGACRLLDFRFDDELAPEPVFLTARVVPDALAVVEVGGTQCLVGVEVDLGTETLAMLRTKLDRWRVLLDSEAPPFSDGHVVLLIVAPAERRRTTIARLAEEGGVVDRVCVHDPSCLEGWIAAGCQPGRTHDPYVPNEQAHSLRNTDFTRVSAPNKGTFRALRSSA